MSQQPTELVNGSATIAEMFDDSLLIKAYEDSKNLVQEELARRIANATNTPSPAASLAGNTNNSQSMENNTSGSGTAATVSYKVGDYCRATYEDGVDYEAKILSITEKDGTCYIRYIGYDNEQQVLITDLVSSWGKKARRLQFETAKAAEQVDNDEMSGAEQQTDSEGEQTDSNLLYQKPGTSINAMQQKQKASSSAAAKKKNNNKAKFAKVQPMSAAAVPPPPPLPPMLAQNSEDNEHLSAMLMSWYMSGYYTGVYQGLQMSKAKGKNKSK